MKVCEHYVKRIINSLLGEFITLLGEFITIKIDPPDMTELEIL